MRQIIPLFQYLYKHPTITWLKIKEIVSHSYNVHVGRERSDLL